eukprot:4753211-Pyramimonas_sp.AAC.1
MFDLWCSVPWPGSLCSGRAGNESEHDRSLIHIELLERWRVLASCLELTIHHASLRVSLIDTGAQRLAAPPSCLCFAL